jgi:arylsulfatase A-like enzyme
MDFTKPDVKSAIAARRLEVSGEDRRFLHLVYEAKLRHTDQQLVRLLIDGLRAADLYDRSLITITADHGAELWEHGGYGAEARIDRVAALATHARAARAGSATAEAQETEADLSADARERLRQLGYLDE